MARVRKEDIKSQQSYQKCQKANRPGADFPALCRDRIFQPSAPGGFKGTVIRGWGTCSPRGQKWGQVVESAATVMKGKITLHDLDKSLSDSNWEPDKSGVTLPSVLCTGSPKSGARPVIISKISSLKLSPGRLWRLGGFQRLDTSSVFWPRNSLGASFVLPAFAARKSKGAAQKNPYQEKNVERLERENITRRCTKTKSDKSRKRRQNEDCLVIEEFEN